MASNAFVREVGVEPTWAIGPQVFETCASAIPPLPRLSARLDFAEAQPRRGGPIPPPRLWYVMRTAFSVERKAMDHER